MTYIDLRDFFKPVISKIIIFVILFGIFGVPAFVKQCATFDFGTGEFPCGLNRLTLHNPLIKLQILDATNIYSYSILLIALHLFVLYSLLSLIYFYTQENKTQRIVYLASFIILYLIFILWINL